MTSEKTRKRILQNFIEMVSEKGWSGVSFKELSERSGVRISTLRGAYSSKYQLLEDFAAMTDQTVLEAVGSDFDGQASPKDRIFDILMTRFETLSCYRDGLKSLTRAAIADPGFGLLASRITVRSMRWMLDGAGIETRGIKGVAKVQGLVLVYGKVSRVWFNDGDKGLSATMVALDRELRRGETVLCQVGRIERTICHFVRTISGQGGKPVDSEDETAPMAEKS